jgi:hypothetical protein
MTRRREGFISFHTTPCITTYLVFHKSGPSRLHLQLPNCVVILAALGWALINGTELRAADFLIDLAAAGVAGVGDHRYLGLDVGDTSDHPLHHDQVTDVYQERMFIEDKTN